VFASVKAPTPSAGVAGLILRGEYAPPIVNLTAPIGRAHKRWLANNPDSHPMRFQYPSVPDLAARLLPRTAVANISADTKWFFGLFKTAGPVELDGTDPRAQQMFLRYFAVNLSPPYACPEHLVETGIDDVSVEWGLEKLGFCIKTCCEAAAKRSWAQMCVYDANKTYSSTDND
jgi:hypothetical protein